jgi:hypothetical protein
MSCIGFDGIRGRGSGSGGLSGGIKKQIKSDIYDKNG